MLQTDRLIPTYGDISKEAKVYKVSLTRVRKNAKRRLAARIFARSKQDAIEIFMKNIKPVEGVIYTLHTGDWKEDIQEVKYEKQ